jgi:hypothetical protein
MYNQAKYGDVDVITGDYLAGRSNLSFMLRLLTDALDRSQSGERRRGHENIRTSGMDVDRLGRSSTDNRAREREEDQDRDQWWWVESQRFSREDV